MNSRYWFMGLAPQNTTDRLQAEREEVYQREDEELWNQQQSTRYKEAPPGKPPASDSLLPADLTT